MNYDSRGRISRIDNLVNGAYARWDYGSWVVTKSTTIQDGAGENHTVTILDGFGRAVATDGDNPGSTGGSWAKFYFTDVMGRPSTGTNPEEISAAWVPSGDDSAGWLWSTPNIYDWKGRPLRAYNMDGTYKEASYGGCGCAGGEVVTLTNEGTIVDGVPKYRKQKIYSDPLGRQWKTEVLNWDGSVYSTTETTLNARDQATLVRQFQGGDTSGVYQDTTMTFDGYGRLQSKHVPEQNSGTATTYTYNNDDTINSVTDARGAAAAYSYNNNRRLVNTITYSAPAGVDTTPNVTFSYDPVGNTTFVSDGIGTLSSSYDRLSRLTSETRHFNELANTSTGGNYTLSYSYNLGGELASVTDQSIRTTVNYAFYSSGRLSAVNRSGFPNLSRFPFKLHYPA